MKLRFRRVMILWIILKYDFGEETKRYQRAFFEREELLNKKEKKNFFPKIFCLKKKENTLPLARLRNEISHFIYSKNSIWENNFGWTEYLIDAPFYNYSK